VIDGKKSIEIHKQLESATNQQKAELGKKTALIVGGESLLKILLSDKLKEHFLSLAYESSVVLACRVSPKQKAQIVMMVR
jgi:magnesium-transporting ATPase (P-type)